MKKTGEKKRNKNVNQTHRLSFNLLLLPSGILLRAKLRLQNKDSIYGSIIYHTVQQLFFFILSVRYREDTPPLHRSY